MRYSTLHTLIYRLIVVAILLPIGCGKTVDTEPRSDKNVVPSVVVKAPKTIASRQDSTAVSSALYAQALSGDINASMIEGEVTAFSNILSTNTYSGKIEYGRSLLRKCEYQQARNLLLPITKSENWSNLDTNTQMTILRILSNATVNMQEYEQATNILIELYEKSISVDDRECVANCTLMLGVTMDALENDELCAQYWDISYEYWDKPAAKQNAKVQSLLAKCRIDKEQYENEFFEYVRDDVQFT